MRLSVLRALLLLVTPFLLAFAQPIMLNTTNHLTIRGYIDSEVANQIVYKLITQPHVQFVYLHTPGGSVVEGERIVQEVKQRRLTCIAAQAFSMGFTILQACATRIVLPHTILMQHQMSVENLFGSLEQMEHLVGMIRRQNTRLTRLQADRLGVTPEWFHNKTQNEWWMYGADAVKNHCADRLESYVKCSQRLTRMNHSVAISRPFAMVDGKMPGGPSEDIYSACPLISSPLSSAIP
jgi:ATP-dependent protease ClpP protease subunit